VSSLEEILFLEKARNKLLSLGPVQKAEYRSMTMVTCELMWIKQFLQELRFCEELQMKLYVIIRLLFILPQTQSFMKGLSTQRLIVISFERSFCPRRLSLSSLILMISQQIF